MEAEDERYCFYRKSDHRSGKILKSKYCIKKGCLTRESIQNSIIENLIPFNEGFSGIIYDVCEHEEGSRTSTNCNKVLKIIPLSEESSEEDNIRGAITYDCNPLDLDLDDGVKGNADCVVTSISQFSEEVRIAKLAADNGIGPRVYDSWVCRDVELEIKTSEIKTSEIGKKWFDGSQILGFILMEKLQGKTLVDFVKSQPELFKRNFYILLASGIDKALKLESRGYKHQDLHGKNIFVVNDGRGIVFIDYGDVTSFPEEFRYLKELFTMESFIGEMLNAFREVY